MYGTIRNDSLKSQNPLVLTFLLYRSLLQLIQKEHPQPNVNILTPAKQLYH